MTLPNGKSKHATPLLHAITSVFSLPLTDAELVAILIRVGFKGTNAVELARHLLKQFGSLRAMVEAPVIALLKIKGLKGAKAAQLIAAMEIARRVPIPAQRGQLVMKRRRRR